MGTIVKSEPVQLVAGDGLYGFSREDIELVKQTVAKGASDAELRLFLMQCQRRGLDPFARQIYCMKRREYDEDTGQWVEKRAAETSIDGFRLISERSGKYVGQLGPFWCGQDGVWQDVWLSDDPPSAAKIGILRADFREPIWGVARYSEYVQTKRDGSANKMWKKMATSQLAKCAETLGLRKAFPQDLSGLHTTEEMDQSRIASDGDDLAGSIAAAKIKMLAQGVPYENATVSMPVTIEAPSMEQQFRDHLVEVEKTRKKKPASYEIAKAFQPMKARFIALDQESQYRKMLGIWGVEKSNEWPATEEGAASARACFKEMQLLIADLEARAQAESEVTQII